MKQTITIGTRGSQLALWQAEYVRKRLQQHEPDRPIELKIIKTKGDRIQNRSLVGLGKGLFTKEIEAALLEGEIDLAVHSMKDLPSDLPEGLCIAAIPSREDARDVLVAKSASSVAGLPTGAKIGTTSPRRRAQLLHLRLDLQIVDIRGNLDTRLRKLRETDLDALILAAAGIKRLVGEDTITAYFERDQMTPAVGQGALGIEARANDATLAPLLSAINNRESEIEIAAERTVLRQLGGGCQVPIGANAQLVNGVLSMIGMVSSVDGKHRIVESVQGDPTEAINLGNSLAAALLRHGAEELLAH